MSNQYACCDSATKIRRIKTRLFKYLFSLVSLLGLALISRDAAAEANIVVRSPLSVSAESVPYQVRLNSCTTLSKVEVNSGAFEETFYPKDFLIDPNGINSCYVNFDATGADKNSATISLVNLSGHREVNRPGFVGDSFT